MLAKEQSLMELMTTFTRVSRSYKSLCDRLAAKYGLTLDGCTATILFRAQAEQADLRSRHGLFVEIDIYILDTGGPERFIIQAEITKYKGGGHKNEGGHTVSFFAEQTAFQKQSKGEYQLKIEDDRCAVVQG